MKIKVRRGASGWWGVGPHPPYVRHFFPTFDEALQYALKRAREERR